MNRSMIRYLLAKLLLIEAALLIVPIIVALIYGEPLKVFLSIGATMAILLVLITKIGRASCRERV